MRKTIIKVDSKIEDGGLVDLLIEKNLLPDITNLFPFIIVGLDKDLKLILYNDVSERYFKYKRKSILNKDFIKTLVKPDSRDQIREALAETIKSLKIKGFLEIPSITKSKKLKFINFIQMLVIKEGKFQVLLMAGSDNTKRQIARMKIDRVCADLIDKNEELVLLYKQLHGREKRLAQLKNKLSKLKENQ